MVLESPDIVADVLCRVQASVRNAVQGDYHQMAFGAMSTTCRVNFRSSTRAVAADFQAKVLHWVATFEARYSRFIPKSLIGRINAAAGQTWIEVDEDAQAVFRICDEMHEITGAVFDPATLPLIRLWNWKTQPPVIPDRSAISAARDLCGWRKLQRRDGAVFLPQASMGLDLGGIGKEYAVDQVLRMARKRGFTDVLVDFGQDVRVCGCSPGKDAWYIGLEDAQQPGKCWTGVALRDQAVATSGDYFRAFTANGRRYGHILDPRSGEPVSNGCLSASVIAPTCTLAGVLATAAFVLGPREGVELVQRCHGAHACITTENGRYQTRSFVDHVVA